MMYSVKGKFILYIAVMVLLKNLGEFSDFYLKKNVSNVSLDNCNLLQKMCQGFT